MTMCTISLDNHKGHNINKNFDYFLETLIQIFTEWKTMYIFQWNVISFKFSTKILTEYAKKNI